MAAEKAVEMVKDGMIVGLGTGSTSYFAIRKIGELIKNGVKIKAVASSIQSEKLAEESQIPLISFAEIDSIDLYIDGADEVDSSRNLIKGGGGAHLREKILAFNSRKFVVVVDESKIVTTLGKFPLPVEIVPFAYSLTISRIELLGCRTTFRMSDGQKYVSDNGNFILDCFFNSIPDPESLNNKLHSIPGVVETGLFLNNMVSKVIVGYKNGEAKDF